MGACCIVAHGSRQTMKDFTLKDSKLIYSGRVVDLAAETIMLPDGKEISREIVRHPGATAIVPMISPSKVVLLRQFRHCAGKVLWEIPAGTLEPGEEPIECAGRELMEETGYRAGELTSMGGFYPSPGICNEYLYLFLATRLEPCETDLDSDEQITVHKVPLDEAFRKIDSGEIVDAKTIVGLLKLGRMEPEIHET
jgi:ADP-ribose pyrophosphatase